MTERGEDSLNNETGATRLRVLQVGPGRGQLGGIASVLGELNAQRSLFQRNGVTSTVFETHGFQSVKSLLCFLLVDIPCFVAVALKHADIVHFHVSVRGSFYRKFALYILARLIGKKTIFHLHAGNFEQFRETARPVVRNAISRFVCGADAVVAVSTAIAEELRPYCGGAHRLHVIGNTAHEAEADAAREQAGNALGNGLAAAPYIAFAGRLTEGKGIDELLRAVASLLAEGLRVTVRLAGDGDIRRWTEAAANYGVSDQVHFVGWLRGGEKLHFYRNAAIFCMPSHYESFGISTLEAMFVGKPVIGTRVGGFLDLVEEGVTGYLVDCGDAVALARSIRDLIERPAIARAMGQAGATRARDHYSVRAIVDQYVHCYRTVGQPEGEKHE